MFPVCQRHYNNSASPFRSAPGGSIAPVAPSLPSLFSTPISATSVPDNYDLVGARGADGVVGAWGGRGGGRVGGKGEGVSGERRREEGREVGVRLFTPRLLIPLLKGFLFNNAGQFPEVGLTPPLFYKEMIFHTQTSPRMQLRCFARQN